VFWRRLRVLTLPILLLAGATRAMPATAQVTEGGSENPPAAGGGATIPPGFPGAAPETLPLPPGGGFGFPNPLLPPNAVNNEIPPLTLQPAGSLVLPPVTAGISTLQQYDPKAPAVLIQPRAQVGLTVTDNARFTHSPRDPAVYATLSPGLSISADTPRFQGVLTGEATGYLYAPTSDLDQILASLYGKGLGTIVPDLMFVDLASTITQSSTLPGFGFQNLSQLPRNQQTQVYINTVSPFLRKSFDGLVDSELRYRFGATNFGGNTTGAPVPGIPGLSDLASGVLNEGTLTVATGQNFQRALSRLTVDALNYNSSSTARNSQFSAFNDLEYRITPNLAALGRAGYQNIDYPFAPEASFVGATWLAGGRVGYGGLDQDYVILQYGRQQGVYGFTGSAFYRITPTMSVTGSLVQGVSSPTQYLQTALAGSTLDPFGAIVDQYSGLPTAFYSPGLGLTNNVYRQHLATIALSDIIGPNRYLIYGTYADQQSLTPPPTPPTKSYGVNFTWNRDIRPDLNSYASVGYFISRDVNTIVAGPPISNLSTVTANLGLNYLLAPALTGSVVYGFTYQTNGASTVAGRTGDIVVNQLGFYLTKTF
jgi:hypothetical protein